MINISIHSKFKKINVFVDNKIAQKIKKLYPKLKFTSIQFNRIRTDIKYKKIISSKSFLGITDLRELRPFFKVLYINNTLPWGEIKQDYSLITKPSYNFTLQGAEVWEEKHAVTIVQTGVTAMTRKFIRAVNGSGDILYPIYNTKTITSQADIAVTSNEVSFLDPCTFPFKNHFVFCSPMRYFKILTESGFDVIELTGNHNNDYGWKHNLKTIIARHHIYKGNHIQTELLPYMIYNNSQPRFIHGNEARDLMIDVFKYSLGHVFKP